MNGFGELRGYMRESGVRCSPWPTGRAQKLCPDLVLLAPNFERYTQESRKIMEIFRSYTPLVEPLSLDEAFLDVAGCERLLGDAVEIGHAIRGDIRRQTGLTASVGIAPSKFLAKLASDLDKPDGFRVIRPDEVRAVLDPLPVSKIFGIGPRTAMRLEALGVRTVGELAASPREDVLARFGSSGAWIHDLAHGIDPRRVTPRRVEKSFSIERTFETDLVDRDELRLKLFSFCEELAYRLRDNGLRGRTITIKARFWNFKTVTRSQTLPFPTNLGPRIWAVARTLLERVPPRAPAPPGRADQRPRGRAHAGAGAVVRRLQDGGRGRARIRPRPPARDRGHGRSAPQVRPGCRRAGQPPGQQAQALSKALARNQWSSTR